MSSFNVGSAEIVQWKFGNLCAPNSIYIVYWNSGGGGGGGDGFFLYDSKKTVGGSMNRENRQTNR